MSEEKIEIPLNPEVLLQRNQQLLLENEELRLQAATIVQELLKARGEVEDLKKEVRAAKRGTRRTTQKGTK